MHEVAKHVGVSPMTVSRVLSSDANVRPETLQRVQQAILSSAQRPTAIFASNDDMAAAAIAVAHRVHLDVPKDLTVVGFDDTPLATTVWPATTTVRQPVAAWLEKRKLTG